MKFIKKFSNRDEHQTFLESNKYVTPNVCLISNEKMFTFEKRVGPQMYDIAYWDGRRVSTISVDKYEKDLGTPVGIVIIPEGFLPDGEARIVSISEKRNYITWGGFNSDTTLTNFMRVPITDNAIGSSNIELNSFGRLPSNLFTGGSYVRSQADREAGYNATSNFIPSPFLNGTSFVNPDYCTNLINGYTNALSDFDGLNNTITLVKTDSKEYQAAMAAYSFNVGKEKIQWYLPSIGELGVLMARLNSVNNVIGDLIAKIGEIRNGYIDTANYYWSSTPHSSVYAYRILTNNGGVYNDSKNESAYVRPFAIIRRKR